MCVCACEHENFRYSCVDLTAIREFWFNQKKHVNLTLDQDVYCVFNMIFIVNNVKLLAKFNWLPDFRAFLSFVLDYIK